MTVYLAGAGCGPETWTKEVRMALQKAAVAAGPARLLEAAAAYGAGAEQIRAVLPEEILGAVHRAEEAGGDCCVLLSGDSGFFSGAKRLLPLLKGYDVRVLPGISSLQVLAARLEQPWQNWQLVSAHGMDCDAVYAVCQGHPVFFLTGGRLGPAQLCMQLAEAGLDMLPVTVGEDLGTENEQIRSGTAAEFAGKTFAPLSVLLAEAAPARIRRVPGFPDMLFRRAEKIPMTKQAVRAVILSLLSPEPEEICWDIGAGTGSVSIELAMLARRVYGIEQKAEALQLAEENRRALGAWNLQFCAGTAPEACRDLPAPDAVFIGGSSGNLRGILQLVVQKNPAARICVSAIILETAAEASAVLGELGYGTEILQLGVSRSRPVGGKHMLLAENPVFLVTGRRA